MRGVNNTLETINAAATTIASAESRLPPASVQKRRWGGCWSMYWCFGSPRQSKRNGRAVVPETTAPGTEVLAVENSTQAPAILLPFVAPPSSPASFLQSEPPSATQSPAGLMSLSSTNMYSPGGPSSIFAIGPYAHETQLVSPPVFSTINTEPSTAPFTPPPESVQFTTPSSPEVPFARLLDPNHQNGEAGQRFPLSHYEFQSRQLSPGSPVSHLISPSSGISGSGTSSPFRDSEFAPAGPYFPEFRTGDPPKLLNLDKLHPREWGSWQGSGSLTPDAVGPKSQDSFLPNCQNFNVSPLTNSFEGWRNDGTIVDHRVSFEVTAEVVRCVEKKPAVLVKGLKAVLASIENAECAAEKDGSSSEMPNVYGCPADETSNDTPEKAVDGGQQHQKHQSIILRSDREFNFDNADGGNSGKPSIGSDWWANEKVIGKRVVPTRNLTFFPMMQEGVS